MPRVVVYGNDDVDNPVSVTGSFTANQIVKAESSLNIKDTTSISEDSSGNITLGSSSNHVAISSEGNLTLVGNATAFDDLVVPLTATKLGANSKPDFDETNIGYLFPQNDASEILYLIVQIPHRWKQGSTIYPHIHYKRTAAGVPTFKMTYSWFNIGDVVSAPSTTLSMATEVITYTSGNIHQINKTVSGIDGTGKTLSSILVIKLFRDDNTVAGDVLAYQYDIHYEIDSLGSNTEYTK